MVDWPRAAAPVPAAVVAVAPKAGAAVVVAGWVADPSPPSLGNRLGAAAGVVAEVAAVVVAVVPGVAAAAGLAPPKLGKSEPPAVAAGVDDGVAEDVAPPRLGKRDFCGVAVDVAVVDGAAEGVPPRENVGFGAAPPLAEAPPRENADLGASPLAAGVPPRENADLGAAPLAEGVPPRENAGWGVVSPPVEGAAAPSPNSGLEAGAAVALGVLDSAGLLTPPNRLPPDGAGAKPRGFEAAGVAPAPKKPPDGCVCVVGVVEEGAVVDDGVVEEPAFSPPKSGAGFDPGGGPAGVVEVLPNKELLAGAGVVDEAPPPNKLPEGFAAPAPPNIPLLAVCPGVVEPVV